MKRFFSLVKISAKSGLSALSNSKKEKSTLAKVGTVILMLIVVAYMAFTFGMISYNMSQTALAQDMMPQVIGIFALMLSVVMVWMSLLYVPSVLFFSEDTQTFMTLPLASWEIALAKFISAYVTMLGLCLFFGFALAGGSLVVDFSVRGLFGWLITLVVTPIWPVAVIALIYLVIFQLAPALRNKDRMAALTGILSIVLAVVFYMGYMNFMESSGYLKEGAAQSLPISESLIDKVAFVFPMIKGAQLMVAGSGVGSFLTGLGLAILPSLAVLLVFVGLTRPLYFRIVVAMSSDASSAKRLDKEEVAQGVAKASSPFFALVSFEWRQLFRTPAYFLGVVVSSFFVPFWMLFVLGLSAYMARDEIFESGINLANIQDLAGQVIQSLGGPLTVGFLVGTILALISLTGGAPATAVSRDAKNIESFKAFPLKAGQVFLAQYLVSYLMVFLPSLILFVIVGLLVGGEPLFLLAMLGGYLLVSIALSLGEFAFDVLFPKLDWEDENKAVKSNFRASLGIFIFMGLPVLVGFAAWKLALGMDQICLVTLLASLLILALSAAVIFTKAEAHLAKMNR